MQSFQQSGDERDKFYKPNKRLETQGPRKAKNKKTSEKSIKSKETGNV